MNYLNNIFSIPNWVKHSVPSMAYNVIGDDIVIELGEQIPKDGTVLVVGCGDGGSEKSGFTDEFLDNNVIASDIVHTTFTDMVCDAQRLPFQDESVDGVICQAVLEHIKNSEQSIDEMLRVLKPSGYLFVDVPFMQPYHALPHDYRRYTVRGLEARFKHLNRIDSGASVGPTTTLLWILAEYIGFVFSFGNSKLQNMIAHGMRFPLFWLKYIDKIVMRVYGDDTWLLKIPSGVYWYGQKSE